MTECDPRNMFGLRDMAHALIWSGDYEAAVVRAEEAFEEFPNQSVENVLGYAYVAAGMFHEAESIADQSFASNGFANQLRLIIAAARGDRDSARTYLEAMASEHPDREDIQLIYLPTLGSRERANEIAAQFDALPYGYVTLASVPSLCLCGAPWDLEVTPNFAAKYVAAGYSWPPASPIEWPLKDW